MCLVEIGHHIIIHGRCPKRQHDVMPGDQPMHRYAPTQPTLYICISITIIHPTDVHPYVVLFVNHWI